MSSKNEVVHLLWYVREPNEREEVEILIGVYSSEAEAQAAVERLRGKPGFIDHPQGFQIALYELDLDHWVEGFKLSGEVSN